MPPEVIEVADRALIYNKDADEWEEGWINIFRRMKPVAFFTNVTIPAPNGDYQSVGLDYKAYSGAIILLRLGIIDPTVGLWIAAQTSVDGETWYQEYAENGSFYGLRVDSNQSNMNVSFKTTTKNNFIRVRAYQIGAGISVKLSASGLLM